MSCPAQHAPLRAVAAPWSYSCSVTPITSCPASASSPAVTELSTPPDIATTTRTRYNPLPETRISRTREQNMPADQPTQNQQPPVPTGVTAYLIVRDGAAAIDFYARAFG